MTRAWKQLVLETIHRRGWSVERLASEVGVARSLAYRLFPEAEVENEIWNSTAVDGICELLGIPPPMEPTDLSKRGIDRRISELVRSLPEESKEMLIKFLESLLGDNDI